MLNDYGFGGYLIFAGIKPFIDGRYFDGDAFIKRYVEATALFTDQLPVPLDEYGITWTLASSKDPGGDTARPFAGLAQALCRRRRRGLCSSKSKMLSNLLSARKRTSEMNLYEFGTWVSSIVADHTRSPSMEGRGGGGCRRGQDQW